MDSLDEARAAIERLTTWSTRLGRIRSSQDGVTARIVRGVLGAVLVSSLVAGLVGVFAYRRWLLLVVAPAVSVAIQGLSLSRRSARWRAYAAVILLIGTVGAFAGTKGPQVLVIGLTVIPFLYAILSARAAAVTTILYLVLSGGAALVSPPPVDGMLILRITVAGIVFAVFSWLARQHLDSISDEIAFLTDQFAEELARLGRGVQASSSEFERFRQEDAETGLLSLEGLAVRFADAAREPGRAATILALRAKKWRTTSAALSADGQVAAVRQFADRLRQTLGPDALIARVGRIEYVVVQWEVETVPGPSRWQQLRTALHELRAPVVVEEGAVLPAPSMGVARWPKDGPTLAACVRCAEIARVSAEQAGLDAPSRFDASMTQRLERRARMTERLRGAIGRGELEIRYQPIVPAGGGPIRRAEALLRWRDAELGEIAPDAFLPLVGPAGLLRSFSRWTIAQAVGDLQRFRREISPDFQVAVNLAPEYLQIVAADAATQLGALESLGVPPGGLIIELTESSFIEMDEAVLGVLEEARRRQVRIAIDDFGTGYSSFDRLQQLPVDVLKIDRAIVQRLDGQRRGVSVVRALLQLASELGLDVVAEGVETEAQRRILVELGCPFIQGYLVAQAHPANQLVEFARQG